MPEGAMPEGAMPEGAMPEGALPEGALPEGALPEGALPEGALPEGALPEGALPNGAEYDRLLRRLGQCRLGALPDVVPQREQLVVRDLAVRWHTTGHARSAAYHVGESCL